MKTIALGCCILALASSSFGQPRDVPQTSAADNGRYAVNGQYVLDTRTGRLWQLHSGAESTPVPYAAPDSRAVYLPRLDDARQDKDATPKAK